MKLRVILLCLAAAALGRVFAQRRTDLLDHRNREAGG